MEIIFQGQRGKFGTETFDRIVQDCLSLSTLSTAVTHTQAAHTQTQPASGVGVGGSGGTEVFEEPMEIILSSPYLPNLKIVDTPGLVKAKRTLTRDDKERDRERTKEEREKKRVVTLVDLLKSMMSDPEKLVIVVEPATLDDLNNSIVLPEML
jgi:hypothetical protein